MKNRSQVKTVAAYMFIGSVCGAGAMFVSGCAPPTAVVQEYSAEAQYHSTMGRASLKEGRLQLAYVESHKALQIDPNNEQALFNLGVVHLRFEEYAKARDYFLKVVMLNPNNADAYSNLGNAYVQLGERTQALEAFRTALANPLYATPEIAFYSIGMLYYRMSDYDNALNAFKDAIKRARTFSLPYYGMALVLNRLAQYGEASEIMNRALLMEERYKGDRDRKREDLKEQLITAKGDDEQDIRDLLEILNY